MFHRQESVASYEDVDLLINEISNVSRRSSLKLLELVGNFLHESRLVKSDVDKLQVSLIYHFFILYEIGRHRFNLIHNIET